MTVVSAMINCSRLKLQLENSSNNNLGYSHNSAAATTIYLAMQIKNLLGMTRKDPGCKIKQQRVSGILEFQGFRERIPDASKGF